MTIKIDKKILIIIFLFLAGGIFAFNYLSQKEPTPETPKKLITVFKDPTCDCCEGYVTYLKRNGFEVKVQNTKDMISIKEKYNISPNFEACHTSVIDNYFIEGHVPIEAINKLLTEKPEIDGITLPGMPLGSPGMGGIKRGSFEIYGLKNGQVSEFGKF